MQAAQVGLQSFTSVFNAQGEAAAHRSAASVDYENARLDRLQGALEVADLRRRGRAVQGEAISAEAASGGAVGGQSAQDLIFQNSLEIEYAAANARYGAAMEARGEEFKAQGERRAAKYAEINGFLGAGASLLSGISAQQNSQRRNNAMFPGGSKLPMPGGGASLPDYRQQY